MDELVLPKAIQKQSKTVCIFLGIYCKLWSQFYVEFTAPSIP